MQALQMCYKVCVRIKACPAIIPASIKYKHQGGACVSSSQDLATGTSTTVCSAAALPVLEHDTDC